MTGVELKRPTSNQNRVPGSPGIGSGSLPKGISALWQERNPNFLPEKFRIKKQPESIFSRPQAAVQQRPRPVQDENITPLSDIFRTGIPTREDDDVPRKPGLYLRPGGKGIKPRHGLMEPSQRDANRDNILANRRSSTLDYRQSPSRDDRTLSTRSHGLLPRRFGH
uniref:Uncharacterized protein n=1 Tax=Panagrolaimus davidi TaxID=227884 RepID=A0A914PGC0_9BILA